jgi:DNA-binding response OmpR family regulator
MEQPLKILILEDSPADAEMVQYALQKKLSCEFYLSKDRPTFIEALDRFIPDIILSDHALPQFNSTDALVLSRQRFPGVPFIMVTGSVSEEFAATIMKMGADDYILKDRLARLPAAMEAALKRYSAERENREAQQKIIESENNLRAIFENTSEGFLLLDRDAVIKAFNTAPCIAAPARSAARSATSATRTWCCPPTR